MMDILYTIFIFPLEQLIALAYLFAFRVFDNPALSVLGVSVAVSVFTLPLYFMAENLQRSERDIQKRMKPEVDNLKAGFSGDERFMRLAVYYRQNKYHPFYALRSSISILIQIPFFIAAYHFLSNAAMLLGVPFGPVRDLSKPDSLFVIGNVTVNILPVIMTVINCVSSAIYAREFSPREKIQLYGMAGVFLVLLYNSPSALVLYWTGNNIFSLIKNSIQKTKNPGKVLVVLLSVFCVLFDIFLLFFHGGALVKRVFLAGVLSCLPLLGIFLAKNKQAAVASGFGQADKANNKLFIVSALVLFLLGGFVIPSSLIRTSVAEFSFVENFDSPFHFLIVVLLQAVGIFIIWPLCVYCMSSHKTRKILAAGFVTIAFVAMINVFLFPGKYGFLSELFTFSEPVNSSLMAKIGNVFLIIFILAFVLLMLRRFRKVIPFVLTVSVCALVFAGMINGVVISREFKTIHIQSEDDEISVTEPVYQFSKTGKNVVVIMLDRAVAGYVPYIFEEKPELHKSFDGFVWHKNTVSFSKYSIFCTPTVFGGYNYTPLEMQARKDVPLAAKQNEALLLLPSIFLSQDYRITVTDPPLANYSWIPDLSIFDDYPGINAKNIIGAYNKDWLAKNKDGNIVSNTTQMLEDHLIRFSFFKFTPLIFRNFVYDHGDWLTMIENLPRQTLSTYVSLDVLPLITKIDNEPFSAYNTLYNDLPHRPYFLQAPEYTLTNNSSDIGSGPFARDTSYHVNMGALLLLGKWFDFLKENGVYDNSRIIVVADHGYQVDSKFPDNIVLPNGISVDAYNPLLLVKDFDAHGFLSVDHSFMTNADVPLIATEGIVETPVNPWTGKLLESDKADGVTITTSERWNISMNPGNTFDIKPDEWMHVHDNIFDPKNWSMVKTE